jgi:hypothetical protein
MHIDLLRTGSNAQHMSAFFFLRQDLYVAQAGLKLMSLLPQPPECSDSKHLHHIRLRTTRILNRQIQSFVQ